MQGESIKLCLTPWAEEQFKAMSDPTMADPEVRAAFTQGYIDMGEGSRVQATQDGYLVDRIIPELSSKDRLVKGSFLYPRSTWAIFVGRPQDPKRPLISRQH